MSEEERKEEGKKARISKPAIISVVVAVLGLLIVPFGSIRQHPIVLKDVFITTAGILGVIALIVAYVSLVSYPKPAIAWMSLGIFVYLVTILARIFFYSRRNFGVWGIVSVLSILFFLFSFIAAFVMVCTKYKIKGSRWKTVSSVTGKSLPLTGAFLATICIYSWLGLYIPRSIAFYQPCWSNLNQISMALRIYANDYDNQYPEPNQWCDLLLKYSDLKPESLIYPSLIVRCPYTGKTILYQPSPKKGRCHFAMNPDCKPSSPSDTVLLFETDEGWNKFGGPELLTTQRNKEEGCYVLLNNKGPQFIPKRKKLKWKTDEGQEE